MMMKNGLCLVAAICFVGMGLLAAETVTVKAKDVKELKDGNVVELPFVEGKEPPKAEDGAMWCLVTKPAEMRTVCKEVLIRPATFYYEVVPAVYEDKTEQALLEPEKKFIATTPATFKTERVRRLVKEESYRLEVCEPQYGQVDECIVVKPAYEEECVIPAQYKTTSQVVETAPAHIEWRKVDCDEKGVVISRRESKDDCYTIIQIPARCETVVRQELVSEARVEKRQIPAVMETRKITKMIKPAETRKVVIPAQYEEVCQEVMVTPAANKVETIPAKYQTVTRKVMVKPEGQRKVEVPAKYETLSIQEMVSPAQLVWRKRAACVEVKKKYGSFPGGEAPVK
jgi:hypothetical protein